jgi:hypothetical protein
VIGSDGPPDQLETRVILSKAKDLLSALTFLLSSFPPDEPLFLDEPFAPLHKARQTAPASQGKHTHISI